MSLELVFKLSQGFFKLRILVSAPHACGLSCEVFERTQFLHDQNRIVMKTDEVGCVVEKLCTAAKHILGFRVAVVIRSDSQSEKYIYSPFVVMLFAC
jgi:hypothetical protein